MAAIFGGYDPKEQNLERLSDSLPKAHWIMGKLKTLIIEAILEAFIIIYGKK